jgi:hypothetical protein
VNAPALSQASGSVLPAVAAYGLAGTLTDFPRAPLGERAWAQAVRDVFLQRVPGFLLAAIAEGAMPATDEQWEQAVGLHNDSMTIAVHLERLLLDTVGLFRSADVEYRVLKGSALAHLDYPDPALRSFGDVDVLVPAESFDTAVRVVAAQGSRRQFATPNRDFDHRFAKGASFITADGRDLDLHRTFVSGPFGLTVGLPDLFASSSPFEVGGENLLALGPEDRFLHACFHAALGDIPPRLLALRDVVQILLYTPFSVDAVRERATRWRAEPVVARAVSLAWETLRIADAVPLSVWAGRYRLDREQQRSLRVYTDHLSTYSAQAVSALWALPTLSERVAYARAMLFPDRAYLAERDRGYLRRMRRGVGTLAHWGRRP